MPNKNSTLTYRWFNSVWNEGLEEAIDELMAEDATIHGIDGTAGPGPEGFKTFYHSFREQFPIVHVEVEDTVSQEGYESSRCSVQATNAKGQEVSFSGMTFIVVKDGKIAESWNNFDFLSMYQQLGFRLGPEEKEVLA